MIKILTFSREDFHRFSGARTSQGSLSVIQGFKYDHVDPIWPLGMRADRLTYGSTPKIQIYRITWCVEKIDFGFLTLELPRFLPFSLFLCCISGFAEPQDPWKQRNSRSSVGSISTDRLLQKWTLYVYPFALQLAAKVQKVEKWRKKKRGKICSSITHSSVVTAPIGFIFPICWALRHLAPAVPGHISLCEHMIEQSAKIH